MGPNLVFFLGLAVSFLEKVCPFTPTKLDDALLVGLKAVQASPDLLALLDSLLNSEKVVKASETADTNKGAFSHAVMDECQAFAAANPGLEAAAEPRGLNWLQLVSLMPGIVQSVMQIMAMFKKQPTPAVASTEEASAAAASA